MIGDSAKRQQAEFTRLVDRFERSVREPRLMMLYPPVSTGRPYAGEPGGGTLWRNALPEGTLYVHVPFCHARCPFCPFYAGLGDVEDYERYVDLVLAEASMYSRHVEHVAFTSVYVGGGTPSVLPPYLIERLLNGLGWVLGTDAADVTLEAHPVTANVQTLRDFYRAGVSRVSLGIQSFDPLVLTACGRADTTGVVRTAVDAALSIPFGDVNADLMYGLPEQTLASWENDVRTAAGLGLPGLTLYATVYLPEFHSRCQAKGRLIPTPEQRLEMYDAAYDFLADTDYHQPHFGAGAFQRCGLNAHRRNISRGLPTLGLGTWSYSNAGRHAYHNAFPVEDWADDVKAGRWPIRRLLEVPEAERPRKHVVEALLLAYVDLGQFRAACGRGFEDVFPVQLAVLEHLGLASIEDGELRLTRSGGHHLREIRYLFASDEVVDALESSGAPGL